MIISSLQFIFLLFIDDIFSANPSFYVTNVPFLEQCSSTSRLTQFNTFSSSQFLCFDKNIRQISITIDYICESNLLKNIWTLKTEKNSVSSWPTKMHILTVHGQKTSYTSHQVIAGTNRDKETISETPFEFHSNQNPLTTYFWVADFGPYCRVKNTAPADICTAAKAGKTFSLKATQFVCVSNKQIYVLQNAADRAKLNTVIDNNYKAVSSSGKSNSTGQIGGSDPNIGALGNSKDSFFEKYKTYLMIGGAGVVALIVIVVIVRTVMRRPSGSTKEQGRKSVVSIESAGTVD